MPLRKFYLKIRVGICRSHPGTAGRGRVRRHSCSEHRATPSLPAEQAARLLQSVSTSPRTSATTTKRLVLMSGFTERRGRGTWAGSCTPKDLFSSGLDWNVVLPEFDSLCNVDEDKIPSLHEGLYLKAQPRVWPWGLCPARSGPGPLEDIGQARPSVSGLSRADQVGEYRLLPIKLCRPPRPSELTTGTEGPGLDRLPPSCAPPSAAFPIGGSSFLRGGRERENG